jgi:shikimate dehydrogenase
MSETIRVGLIGWPVGHSISPAMHNAAFAALNLNWQYTAVAVPPDDLEKQVSRLVNEEACRGFNVTIPHKQAILRHPQIQEISPAVQAIGAANTITVLPGGALKADNTDWQGFVQDLHTLHVAVEGKTCLLLGGAGGAGRAVTYALRQLQAADVALFDIVPGPEIRDYAELPRLAPGAGLVINCTPLGMAPDVSRSPWPAEVPFPPGAVLYDLIYNPPVTRFMDQARAAGARVFNGLGMLVWQGAMAFEIWTGVKPPVDIMFAAGKNALKEQLT